MKNRKLLIISFLVVATVVTGVGFAAVTGILSVTGEVAFFGHEMIQDNVAGAISFEEYEVIGEEECKVVLGQPNELGSVQTATVDVNFYDKTGNTEEFSVGIKFTIKYGAEGDDLPVIHLGELGKTITQVIENQPGTFGCEVVWADAGEYVGEHPTYRELSAGETAEIIVTVSYRPDYTQASTPDNQFSAGIRVAIPYSTECPVDDGEEG